MEKEEKEKEEEKGIKQDEPESRIYRRDTGSWGTEEAGNEERQEKQEKHMKQWKEKEQKTQDQ